MPKDALEAFLSNSPWCELQAQQGVPERSLVAKYAAASLSEVKHAAAHVIGPGLTPGLFVSALLERQQKSGKPLDLTLVTNSHGVVDLVNHFKSKPNGIFVFNNMQVIDISGTVHGSLNAKLGSRAARELADSSYIPDSVVMGAHGLICDPKRMSLYYYYDQELSVQEALATRPTKHRIILASAEKIGRTSVFRANVSFKSLLTNTKRCSIVSSMPTKADAICSFKAQVAHLQDFLTSVAESDDPSLVEKRFDFITLDGLSGQVCKRYSLVNNKFEYFENPTSGASTNFIASQGKQHPSGLKVGIAIEDTEWYDCDSSNLPMTFAEAVAVAPDERSQKSYHLAAKQSTHYVTLYEFLKEIETLKLSRSLVSCSS